MAEPRYKPNMSGSRIATVLYCLTNNNPHQKWWLIPEKQKGYPNGGWQDQGGEGHHNINVVQMYPGLLCLLRSREDDLDPLGNPMSSLRFLPIPWKVRGERHWGFTMSRSPVALSSYFYGVQSMDCGPIPHLQCCSTSHQSWWIKSLRVFPNTPFTLSFCVQ